MSISAKVLQRLYHLLGHKNVCTQPAYLLLNGYDCSPSWHRPDAVLNITEETQLVPLLRLLNEEKIPFIARAAATNHAGSCTAVHGGVVLNLNALHHIGRIDTVHGFAEVSPCTITGDLQQTLAPLGFFYAPDPASEKVSTLGGNLAQNASGARCMKYGNTADNTLSIDFITPRAEIYQLHHDAPGPDWLGLVAGSEGTLGIIQKMRVRILPKPKLIRTFLAAFPSLETAVQSVSSLVAHGLIPRCIEAMDQVTIQAVEAFTQAGYPTNAQALLIIELDGDLAQIEKETPLLEKICRQNSCQTFSFAQTEEERNKLWQGRRAAYAAMASLAPNVAVGDGTVPRAVLPQALAQVREIIHKYGVTASLLFHAGDGNFHPQIVFNAANNEQSKQVHRALQEILKTCVHFGGTVSGEHGIGVEKRAVMAYQYDRQTLRLFQKIKQALDPNNLANPGKIIPFGFETKAREAQETDPAIGDLIQEIKKRFDSRQISSITGSMSRWKPSEGNPLSSVALNKILDIDTANYTATVQAGIKLKDLSAALHEQGVYALLPTGDLGTLGGLVATKTSPEFTNQIIGIQAILPNGDMVEYGGKLMKNAAGYNLCRLFTGSQGALGFITRLTFKIYASALPEPSNFSFVAHKADSLFRAVKKQIDPFDLFISPAFGKEK